LKNPLAGQAQSARAQTTDFSFRNDGRNAHKPAVIRAYDEADNVIEPHEMRVISKELNAARNKSRHAVKHDGSLFRLIDQL